VRTESIKVGLLAFAMLLAARAFCQDSRIQTASKSLSVSATDSGRNSAGTVTIGLSCNAFGLDMNVSLNPATGVELKRNEPDKTHAHTFTTSTVMIGGASPSLRFSEDDRPNVLHFYVMGPQIQQDRSGLGGLVVMAGAYTGESSIGSIDQFFSSSEVVISTPARIRGNTGLVVIKVPTASNEVQSFRKACTDLTNVPPKPTGADIEKTIAYARQYLNPSDKAKLSDAISLFGDGRSTGNRSEMVMALSRVSQMLYRNDVLRPVYDQMNAIIQQTSKGPSRTQVR
jgi:hypothetical protein